MAEENGWVVFAQVASPIVALALGVVGVWNEKIKNRLFGPRLKLEVNEPGGHSAWTVGGSSYQSYLVTIRNDARRKTAQQAYLRLVELEKIHSNGEKEQVSVLAPMPLPVAVNHRAHANIKTFEVFVLGFVKSYKEGYFSFAVVAEGIDTIELEPRVNAKIGLEIQADNLPHSKTKYLNLTWQDNPRSQDSPWPAIPVLSLAD